MEAATQRLAIGNSVIHTMLDGEALVLNIENGIYFGLDGTGARIWELLEGGATTEDEIAATLLAEYDVPPDQLHSELKAFLQLITSRGLIQTSGQ